MISVIVTGDSPKEGNGSIPFDSVKQTESKRLFRRLVTLSHVNDRRALLKAYYR